jgi:hypothetical protein
MAVSPLNIMAQTVIYLHAQNTSELLGSKATGAKKIILLLNPILGQKANNPH